MLVDFFLKCCLTRYLLISIINFDILSFNLIAFVYLLSIFRYIIIRDHTVVIVIIVFKWTVKISVELFIILPVVVIVDVLIPARLEVILFPWKSQRIITHLSLSMVGILPYIQNSLPSVRILKPVNPSIGL